MMHMLHGYNGAHGGSGEHGDGPNEHPEPDAQQILLARYARGEINEEQLTHMRRILAEAEGSARGPRGR